MMTDTRAITLIEMIAIIVVLGLAIPPLMIMWQNLAFQSGRSAVISQGAFYTQELMEEIKSKDFVDPDDPSNTALGPNGEVYPNFDDVDDFNGYSDNPASGYSRSVTVDYVALSGSTWGGSGGSTDFKRVTVSVSHRFGNTSLVSIESRY